MMWAGKRSSKNLRKPRWKLAPHNVLLKKYKVVRETAERIQHHVSQEMWRLRMWGWRKESFVEFHVYSDFKERLVLALRSEMSRPIDKDETQVGLIFAVFVLVVGAMKALKTSSFFDKASQLGRSIRKCKFWQFRWALTTPCRVQCHKLEHLGTKRSTRAWSSRNSWAPTTSVRWIGCPLCTCGRKICVGLTWWFCKVTTNSDPSLKCSSC